MSKTERKIGTAPDLPEIMDGLQNQTELPGMLNLDACIRNLISDALKETPLSRYEVASAMSRLLGREITKGMLDCWSSETKTLHRFPAAFAGAFAKVTGDRKIISVVCRAAGGFFIGSKDALRLELGRIYERRQEVDADENAIRRLLEKIKDAE